MKKVLFSVLFASLFFLIFPILFSNSFVHAATYCTTSSGNCYVDGVSGLDTNDGKTTTTAWKTIGQAVSKVAPGDTVNVKGGITYSETVTPTTSGTSAVNVITYQSWPGTGIPIVQGFIVSSRNYLTFQGFWVTGPAKGFNLSGGTNTYITIQNNIIAGCTGNGVDSGTSSTNIMIDNNTIYGNTGTGINIVVGAGTQVMNNIITNNTVYGINKVSGSFSGNNYSNNDVYGNSTGDYFNITVGANTSVDPLYITPGTNFQLQKGSPAIDTGTTLANVTTDILGVGRPQAGAYDMGAYELVPVVSIYYVAGDTGSDSNDGSILTPWKTIQKAANTMMAGDTVNVKGGVTYSGTVTPARSGTSGHLITYQPWAGTGTPTIDGANNSVSGFVVFFIGLVINGFKIQNTDTGIYLYSTDNLTVKNNIIINPHIGLTSYGGSTANHIYNNVMYGASLVGISSNNGDQSDIKNNIVINSSYGLISTPGSSDYNLVWNNGFNYKFGAIAGAHDISLNPLLVDPANGDFHLQKGSPAINTGTDLTSSGVTTDILGVPRPQDSAFDIGAFEYYDIPVTLASTPPSYVNSGTLTTSGVATTISGGVVSLVSYSVDGGAWITNGVTGLVSLATSPFTITTPSLPDGTHTVRIRATDSYGNTTDSSLYVSVTSTTDSIVRNVGAGTGTNITCSSTTPTGKAPWIYQTIGSGKNSVTLKFTNWQTPTDHFTLEYGTKSGVYQYAVDNIGGNGTNTYTVNSLNPNTTYYFRVRTGNGCAVGSWSNEISGRTGKTSTSKPQITNSKTKIQSVITQPTMIPTPKPLVTQQPIQQTTKPKFCILWWCF